MCAIEETTIPRVMLHARTLGFVHPTTGVKEEFTRPVPADIALVMAELEQCNAPGENAEHS